MILGATVLWLSEGPAINTGDWDRATRPAGFLAPAWEPMKPEYELKSPPKIENTSVVGLVFGIVGSVIYKAGDRMIETGPFVGALFLVMLGGCFFLACGMDRKAYYLVLAVLSVISIMV